MSNPKFFLILWLLRNSFAFLPRAAFINEKLVRQREGVIYAIKDQGAKKEGRKLTPAQKAIQRSAELNQFDKFKQVAYGAADGIQKIGVEKDKTTPKLNVFDGYSDRQKRATPAEKLKRVVSYPSTVDARPSLSVFESLKGAVYGTADAASSIGGKLVGSETKAPAIEKEKVPTKRTISQEIVDSIPDLQSDNPIKRLAAEAKLRNLELEEQARKKQREIEDSIDKVKQTIYTTGDVINETVETIKAVPEVINETVENVKAIPDKVQKKAQEITDLVQKTVDDITAIPGKVEARVNKVQRSVEETVENTKKFIEDVKAIPSKVEESVENTKKTIDNTKKAIGDTAKTVEEVTTNTKIFLGLEKPKPKPPKLPPPKPKTASDYAFQALGTVASATGKALFWVGKGTADLTVKAAQLGFEAAKESVTKQQQEYEQQQQSPQKQTQQQAVRQSISVPSEVYKPEKVFDAVISQESTTIRSDITDTADLENDIAEALKLAEDALQVPSTTLEVARNDASTELSEKSSKNNKKSSKNKKNSSIE